MKTCTQCNITYADPELNFNKKASTKDGLDTSCKVCLKHRRKKIYQNNKEYYIEKGKRNKIVTVQRNRDYIISYLKDHHCVDCGEDDILVLEFDHLDNKVNSISQMRCSPLKAIIKEIAKCEVRCANCHRRKTAKQFGHYKYLLLNDLI